MNDEGHDLLTPKEVAERLGFSVRWVRRHRRAIGFAMIGGVPRITRAAFDAFLVEHSERCGKERKRADKPDS